MDSFLQELSKKAQAGQAPPSSGAGGSAGGAKGESFAQMLHEFGGMEKMQGHAQHLWQFLDELSESDPQAYKEFLSKQYKEAKAAGAVTDKMPIPSFMKDSGDSQNQDNTSSRKEKSNWSSTTLNAKSGRQSASDFSFKQAPRTKAETIATFVVHSALKDSIPTQHACIRLWRADDPESVRPPVSSRSEDMPVEKEAEPRALQIELRERCAPSQGVSSRGEKATMYDVDCHPKTISMALENEFFRAVLIERAFQVTEMRYTIQLSRIERRVETAVTEIEASGKTIPGMQTKDTSQSHGSAIPDSLVSKLSTLVGTSPSKGRQVKESRKVSKPSLIQEMLETDTKLASLDPENDTTKSAAAHNLSYRIERVAPKNGAGNQALNVKVVVDLPLLSSAADVELCVGLNDLTLRTPKGESLLVLLPCKVDEKSTRAKFDKKAKKLAITLRPLA